MTYRLLPWLGVSRIKANVWIPFSNNDYWCWYPARFEGGPCSWSRLRALSADTSRAARRLGDSLMAVALTLIAWSAASCNPLCFSQSRHAMVIPSSCEIFHVFIMSSSSDIKIDSSDTDGRISNNVVHLPHPSDTESSHSICRRIVQTPLSGPSYRPDTGRGKENSKQVY